MFKNESKTPSMGIVARIAGLMLLGSGLVFPVVSAAQSKSPPSATPLALTEQQRAGKILFLQNCALCHLPRRENLKSMETKPGIGPSLSSVFKGDKPLTDVVARTFIKRGVADKMPSFQYGLEPKEIDNIIAYLKTL